MAQIEYKVKIRYTSAINTIYYNITESEEEMLNRLGEDGWVLVSVLNAAHEIKYYFKRETHQ